MIWYITWASAASIVAVIEFAVACRYMYKYEELQKSYSDWRKPYLDWRCCFSCPPSLDEIRKKNNEGRGYTLDGKVRSPWYNGEKQQR